MGRLVFAWLLFSGLGMAWAVEPTAERFEFVQTEMAMPVRIVLYAPDNATARRAAEAAFQRFHQLNAVLSDYDPQSELRRLGDTSGGGKAVPVSDDLWKVLVKAQEISKRSDGAFDVTIGPVVRLWRSARQTKELPKEKSILAALSRVGYQWVRLFPDQRAVELVKPDMRLDLGGIGKGYAVDQAMIVLRRHGITRMMIDAGGNLGLGESPPGKPGWRVGIAPPDARSEPRIHLHLSQISLSTSGDLWQHTIIDGVRYSHLIDPRTGMAMTDRCQVTVIGPDGLDADGLSSAVLVLGPKRGLELIESPPGAEALIVRVVEGREEVYESKGWRDRQ